MTLVVASLLLCLTLGAGLEQTKPDFSGKWTKIPTAPGEAVETLTISQTAAMKWSASCWSSLRLCLAMKAL